MSQINAAGTPIRLEIGKGTLVRLPRPASTVFVANPDVADVQVKSPSLVYITAKAPGETVIYAVDSSDNVLLNAPINVEHDVSRMRQSLNTLLPGQDISVNSVENSVVLSGAVADAGQAEKARSLASSIAGETKGAQIVNQLNVQTPNQVNVRVRVAEVNRSVLKSIGVNWTKATGNFQFNTNNPTSLPGVTGTNSIIYSIPLPGNTARLNAELDALTQEGLVTDLAEPNLTVVSGQPASFLAGGQFPVPTAVAAATTGGLPTITVTFKSFGVSLDVTPTIIDAEHINLKVRPEVSALSPNGAVQISGFSIPALTVNQAETSIELGSGESFALAGLLRNNSTQNVTKVPWLGDVPVLGALFRSEQFQRNESELVIIITPYLVKPSETALATPMDGYVAPHDAQQVINGDFYRQGLPAPARGPIGAGGKSLIGPAGFRLD
ncbi:MAG: type II and III secretion system protein family protein [Alphaproteobacteria bacterium]|nr:type II and III secretion system protein family protein [Alphaproteobacteria bacterium]